MSRNSRDNVTGQEGISRNIVNRPFQGTVFIDSAVGVLTEVKGNMKEKAIILGIRILFRHLRSRRYNPPKDAI